MATDKREWVALLTMTEKDGDGFWEAGGIYASEPVCQWTEGSREFQPGEHVVECPRCGQRFAESDGSSAEKNRDLHFYGNEEIPSICRGLRIQ